MADDELIRDPKRLRALSHPLRWELIDLLTVEGSATATRCAQVLGESVASCSYHLNMLAKYGFVEEAPGGTGREKPWRATSAKQDFRLSELDEEGALAGEAAADALLEREMTVLRKRIRAHGLEPEEWRGATGIINSNTFLTAEEAAEVRTLIMGVVERYRHRLTDPDSRPEGAREVRIFTATTVAPERPEPT
ncbi:winged helix-turn-helix domain-containing protein [Prauserella cavernicola]|uniref:Helix-turn-helix transcriptional regulator n=1 Tax=Prauserella cavernicola TaxID=2800127 RepID=A0A934QUL9_9PSEU|nr:helix-turn-helix domain-containing protein [Prauserella cavernicola]MBK1785648.1 helix-turn-helix transcriptional regulator [Prauserella cavernicola]